MRKPLLVALAALFTLALSACGNDAMPATDPREACASITDGEEYRECVRELDREMKHPDAG